MQGSSWVAEPLGGVMSYQRMAVACSEIAIPPFMSDILGIQNSRNQNGNSSSSIYKDSNNGNNGNNVSGPTPHSSDSLLWQQNFMQQAQTLSNKSRNQIISLNQSQLTALRDCLGESEVITTSSITAITRRTYGRYDGPSNTQSASMNQGKSNGSYYGPSTGGAPEASNKYGQVK
jgi:hypothetical protein